MPENKQIKTETTKTIRKQSKQSNVREGENSLCKCKTQCSGLKDATERKY